MKRIATAAAFLATIVALTGLVSCGQTGFGPGPHSSGSPLDQRLALIDIPPEADFEGERPPGSRDDHQELRPEEQVWLNLYRLPYQKLVDHVLDVAQDSTNPFQQKLITTYLEQTVRVYHRAEIRARNFDRMLDEGLSGSEKGFSPLGRGLYRDELLPLWSMRERMRKQILYVLQHLLVLEADDTTGTTPQKRAAVAVLNAFRDVLNKVEGDEASQLALQDFMRELSHELEAYLDLLADVGVKTKPQNIVDILGRVHGLSPEASASLTTLRAKAQQGLEDALRVESQLIKEESASRPSWMSVVLEDARQDFKESETLQSSASAAICPDAMTSRGHISGGKFPKGVWALTIDDGPHGTHSETIRAALDANGIKASFFWLSQLTARSRSNEIIRKVKAGGHVLANHSHSHANLPNLNDADLKREITQSNKIHSTAFGLTPKFFRCPYGACGKPGGKVRKLIADNQMVSVFWNVDSLDWQDKNPQILFDRVTKQIKAIDAKGSGGIILFHDIHATSAETIVKLSRWMRDQKMRFMELKSITNEMNQGQACSKGWTPN